jgi:hypothetical protein
MENIEAMLCAYIEGDLDATGRAQIEKHLQDHPQHRKLIQELSAMRDLVRGLPRVKAPMEVGESLRGKVERSMLLGDTGDAELPNVGGNRWPQVFAIAAILLLCASLGLVLYKALSPTMKPAVFTEGDASKLTAIPPAADLTISPRVPTTQESPAANIATDTRQVLPGSAPVVSAFSAVQRPLAALQQKQQQVVAAAQLNLEAIRKRLLSSGYDIGSAGANASSPALMVVNSTDLPATNAQVTQFLSDNSGISWKQVPANAAKWTPATEPSARDAIGGNMSASADDKASLDRETKAPTTQPASDVYVAKGLTPQQADELRQSLAGTQNGAEVEVFLQPAGALATTQPSEVGLKDSNSNQWGAIASPATLPSETANSALELAAPPATMPANDATEVPAPAFAGGNRVSSVANGSSETNSPVALTDNLQILQPADTVIVVQSAAAAASMPGPAGQVVPAVRVSRQVDSSPATQPSSTTQP